MSERDDFLANIRGALGRSAPIEAPVSEVPHSAGPLDELERRAELVRELISRDADNLMSILARVAETSGWKVTRVPDARAAGDYVSGGGARDRGAVAGLFAPSHSALRSAPGCAL